MAKPAIRVSLRPNLHSLSLLGLLGAMLFVGGVQDNSAAYLLAFLTAMLALLSALRARENLRGIGISATALGSPRARLQLQSLTRNGAYGIEIRHPTDPGLGWTFVDAIDPGGSASAALLAQHHRSLLLQSHFPLGLVTARRIVQLPTQTQELPEPAGSLPLPEPLNGDLTTAARAAGLSQGSAGGDDFAGLRLWQPGESRRRIAWRNVAKGLPLMVKQWQQPSNPQISLQWDQTRGEDAARVAQLRAWMAEACRRNLRWELGLPNEHLGPDQGEGFQQTCDAALQRLLGQSRASDTPRPRQRHLLPTGHEHQASLATRPLMLLCAVLFCCGLLLQEILPLPTTVLFALCCVWRLGRPQAPASTLRGRLVHWPSLLALVVGAIILELSTGKLLSLQSGIAILMVLLGAKLLESRTAHDFQVLALVGWFLCLCGLLPNQTLNRSLCILLAFTLIAVCMNRFRRHARGMKQPLRLAAILVTQAMTLASVIYFTFPRGSLAFLSRLGVERRTLSGINEELRPGEISELVQSREVAFRAEFPELQEPPAPESRYWRCVVLWHCEDGLNWQRRSPSLVSTQPKSDSPNGATPIAVSQWIQLLPTGQSWLPALDQATGGSHNERNLTLNDENCLRATGPVETVLKFKATSILSQRLTELTEAQRKAALQLPASLPQSIRDLTKPWTSDNPTPQECVRRAVTHLQRQGFKYSLEPGLYDPGRALEQFLLERREGFCEHYAASFATLMRACGIPSRVVIGYMGGEWSQRGGYMIIRQSDAHAWVELWIRDLGWVRVDPTIALVPGRMTLDLQTLLADNQDHWMGLSDRFWQRYFQQASLWWDQLEYDWYSRVISFDEESQYRWLRTLGLQNLQGPALLLLAAFAILILLGLLVWRWRRLARPKDAMVAAWLRLCSKVAAKGMPARRPHEAAQTYAQRLAPALHGSHKGETLLRLIEDYSRLRYGPPCGGHERREWVRRARAWRPG